mmetsp:Transcript_60977/g.96950  ORF Transcript_60977/g.96950 Transcript_60977/m.96950 type:complete len:204 (+) Transcript_60977:176-787(+)
MSLFIQLCQYLLDQLLRVLGRLHRMSNGSFIIEDLKIIASFVCFIAKKVYLFEALLLDKPQTIRLIPTMRKHIIRDLATDGALELLGQLRQLGLELLDHFLSNLLLLIKLEELDPFLLRAVATHRRHVDHSIPEFNECAAFLWQLESRDIHQTEVDKLLDLLLAQLLLEIVRVESLRILPCTQSILAEHKVKECAHIACFRAA